MRKHLLSKLTAASEAAPTLPDLPAPASVRQEPARQEPARQDLSGARQDYVDRGASRSMRLAIEDIAETSRRMTSGEVVVEIDAGVIDPSPIRDRLEGGDPAADAALRESIAAYGQRVPILIRPNPAERGRYVTVYGHRRVAAARALGKPVRAVIAQLSDEDAYVAQGQENNDRRDTSFIEKALFATRLRAKGLDRARVAAALGVADTLVSKMTAIAERIPMALIQSIGPAPSVGRPKWESLAALIETAPDQWKAATRAAHYKEAASDGRFALVLAALQRDGERAGGFAPVADAAGLSFALVRRAPKEMTIRIPLAAGPAPEGVEPFGEWVAARLSRLREEWLKGR